MGDFSGNSSGGAPKQGLPLCQRTLTGCLSALLSGEDHVFAQEGFRGLIKVLDRFWFSKSVSFTGIDMIDVGDASPAENLDDLIRLLAGNNPVDFSLKDGKRVLDLRSRK